MDVVHSGWMDEKAAEHVCVVKRAGGRAGGVFRIHGRYHIYASMQGSGLLPLARKQGSDLTDLRLTWREMEKYFWGIFYDFLRIFEDFWRFYEELWKNWFVVRKLKIKAHTTIGDQHRK